MKINMLKISGPLDYASLSGNELEESLNGKIHFQSIKNLWDLKLICAGQGFTFVFTEDDFLCIQNKSKWYKTELSYFSTRFWNRIDIW